MAIDRSRKRRRIHPSVKNEEFVDTWEKTPLGDRHIVVVDEFGNAGECKPHETKFGYGVSEVKSPYAYGRISRIHRKIHRTDEKKASKTSVPERTVVSAAIRLSGTKTTCVYVDKKEPLPEGMRGRKTAYKTRFMLDRTLDKTLPETGTTWVVVDNNNQYGKDKVREICGHYTNKKRTVCGEEYSSKGSNRTANLLQTNDFVANAARSKLEFGKGCRARIMRTVFKKQT